MLKFQPGVNFSKELDIDDKLNNLSKHFHFPSKNIYLSGDADVSIKVSTGGVQINGNDGDNISFFLVLKLYVINVNVFP